MVCGVLFTAVGVANAWIALTEHKDRELFEKLGRSTRATVVRQFIAPNGRTRRIEFRVDGVPNAPDVNVEVDPILWMAMTPQQHIRVIAVPRHPDIAHLPIGEIQDNSAPSFVVMLPLSMGICLFAVATFVVGILVFRGMQAKWI